MSLTRQAIRGMVVRRANPLARRLVGYWPMLEGTGNVCTDYSGHGNHGALVLMNPSTDWMGGPYGTSLSFDGIDSRVDCPPLDTLTHTTMSIRVYLRGITGFGNVVGNFASNLGFRLQFRGSDSVTRWFYGNGEQDWLDFDDPNTLLGRWMHIVCVVGDQAAAYLDGVEVQRDSAAQMLPSSAALTFGTVPGGGGAASFFDGMLSDVAIYNRVLTSAEIAQLYADPQALFPYDIPPPSYDIEGSNAYGADQISFGWTVNPA